MGVAAVCCLVFARTMGAPGVASAVIFLVGLAISYALFLAANAKLVLSSAPMEQKGAASAVYGTIYNLGLLVGVNIFETLYTAMGASLKKAQPK